MKEKLEKYMNKDINNPEYLFYGSSERINMIPVDTGDQEYPMSYFPTVERAAAFALRDNIKKNSEGLDYSIIIQMDGKYPIMTMKNVNVNPDITGYIYVVKYNDDDFTKHKYVSRYMSNKEITPIDEITIKYSDFEKDYEII